MVEETPEEKQIEEKKPDSRPQVDQWGKPLKRPFAPNKRPSWEDTFKMREVEKQEEE